MEARKLLTSQAVGNGAFGNAEFAVRKWAPLLEGFERSLGPISPKELKYRTALFSVLLENENQYLKNLNEETLSTNVGPFTKYIFPILRRVFPNLIAPNLVSVQPMTAPIGGIATYEYKHEDTKGNAAANTNLIENFQRNYSSEFVDYEVKVDAANVDGVKTIWSNAQNGGERIPFKWLPLRPNEDTGTYAYKVVFNWTSGGVAKSQVDDGAGGFTGDGNPAGSSVNYTTGEWSLDTTGDTPDAGTPIYATYFYNSELVSQTDAPAVTGYANQDQVAQVPGVKVDIAITTVKAGTRKLRAQWTVEASDDMKAMWGKMAETELVAGIANEIALELDREIIDDLINGASHSATFAYGPAFSGANVHTSLDSIRDLLTSIESVSGVIHKTTLRAPANWIVVSPQVAALLAQLTSHGDFMIINRAYDQQVAPSYGTMNSNFGVQRVGTLMNKYAVYQDPFIDAGTILMGLKGVNFLDAGYVYAPYIPLQVTPTFLDPDTQVFKKGFRTRYAKKLLRKEFYGKVTVTGLPTVIST